MENSTYVPNPLPPSALVVFSQAGGLPEALRMQRPFNTQTTEVKDLHIPFTATGFGLRHMDSYPSLPAHLLHHLQPQFLHPALDPRVPFGSGAFRPLGSGITPDVKGFPSAFAPPSKCLKMETSNSNHHNLTSTQTNHLSTLFSPGVAAEERVYLNGQIQQHGADSSSPASVSISPPLLPPVVKEESSDAPLSEDREGTATPGSEGTERSTPDEGRGLRRYAPFEFGTIPLLSNAVEGVDAQQSLLRDTFEDTKLLLSLWDENGIFTAPKEIEAWTAINSKDVWESNGMSPISVTPMIWQNIPEDLPTPQLPLTITQQALIEDIFSALDRIDASIDEMEAAYEATNGVTAILKNTTSPANKTNEILGFSWMTPVSMVGCYSGHWRGSLGGSWPFNCTSAFFL